MEGTRRGARESGGGRSARPSTSRTVVVWACWWVVAAAFWLFLVDDTKPIELVIGAVAASIAATAAGAVETQRIVSLRPSPRFVRRAWRPLARLFLDTGILTAALWRRLARREEVEG